MKLSTKILIGCFLVTFIVTIRLYTINKIDLVNLRQDINTQNIEADVQRILNKIERLQTENTLTTNQLNSDYLDLTNQIIKSPGNQNKIKSELENKLRKVTVIIYNKSSGSLGSGVIIKWKNKYYILSAGHMSENTGEVLAYGENGQEIGILEIVKQDYTLKDENDTNFTARGDLLLAKPKYLYFIPEYYVDIAEEELQPPEQIYIVGNPMGIEDVLSDGRIINYINNFMYYIDHTYFGNSGGGVFTREGNLIGIVSYINPLYTVPGIPPYMTYGAVRLNVIRFFLKDIE